MLVFDTPRVLPGWWGSSNVHGWGWPDSSYHQASPLRVCVRVGGGVSKRKVFPDRSLGPWGGGEMC
eukprot:365293-Chlamydomonas_euryale.AAC.3